MHDWVRKVIDLELCKILMFDHTNKLYIYAEANIRPKNETHKILLDFDGWWVGWIFMAYQPLWVI